MSESSPPAPFASPSPRPVATRAPGPGRAVSSIPRPNRPVSARAAALAMMMIDRGLTCVDWRRPGVVGEWP